MNLTFFYIQKGAEDSAETGKPNRCAIFPAQRAVPFFFEKLFLF